ncbi:MAG: glycosyltransferase family 39 protein [Bdellovibrionales bacterium]|nr:glycosyltransferase family 39 protein [Bdellovibrionales bacterium]
MARTLMIPFVLLFLLKAVLAAIFPVFGDEAYYVFWGSHPAGGYYDLPPMIGWWLAPLLRISSHPLWIRIWNLLVPALITFGIYEWLLKSRGRAYAGLTALLFFALPLPFLTVLSFPDVPLMFFCFFSALLFHAGVTTQRSFLSPAIVMSGALFGAAFLSKYFAVFLLPAFSIWAWPIARSRAGVILSFFAGSAPFLFQHILWNERNCRANAVFNLITRQRVSEGSPLETTGVFFLHLILVSLTVTPFLRRPCRSAVGRQEGDPDRFLLLLWLIPTLVFLSTALMGRGQGLHWLLYLTPFFVAWASHHLSVRGLKGSLLFSVFLSTCLGSFFCAAFLAPERVIPPAVRNRYPFEFGVIVGAKDFVNQLKSEVQGSQALLFQSYGLASLVFYEFQRFGEGNEGRGVLVATSGSRFGRAFDFYADWKTLQGKTLSIINPGRVDAAKFRPYFTSLEETRSTFRGAGYFVVTGKDFDARKFWSERVLPELEEFYPREFSGACALKEVFRAD